MLQNRGIDLNLVHFIAQDDDYNMRLGMLLSNITSIYSYTLTNYKRLLVCGQEYRSDDIKSKNSVATSAILPQRKAKINSSTFRYNKKPNRLAICSSCPNEVEFDLPDS